MKRMNKFISVLIVLSMLLSGLAVSVNATTAEDDGTITIGFGTDCGYAYEYTANKVAFATDYIKITHNGSLITQGYFADKTPQGQKIEVPAGVYDVYINVSSHYDFSVTVAGLGDSFTSETFTDLTTWGTYTDAKIGTITTTGISTDTITVRHNGNGEMLLKSLKLVPSDDVLIGIGNNYGYAYKLYGGTDSVVAEGFAKLITGNAALGYGYYSDLTPSGKNIVIPKGKYEVYAHFCSSDPVAYTIENLGTNITSQTFTDVSWGGYKEYKLGELETDGVDTENIIIRQTFDGSGSTILKYLKLVKVEDSTTEPETPAEPIIPDIPDDADEVIIPFGTESGYATSTSGEVIFGSDVVRLTRNGASVTQGIIDGANIAGTKIVLPAGRFDVYAYMSSPYDFSLTVTGFGDTFTSRTFTDMSAWGTYVEEKIGTVETDGVFADTMNLKHNGSGEVLVKYLKFVRNEIVYPGSTVVLDDEVTLTAADVVGGEEISFAEGNANVSLPESVGVVSFSVNAANAGRYELYANMTSESAMYSHTIVVNGEKQPSLNFNPKNGKNFLGYVDLNAGVNTISLNQNLGSVTLNSLTLRYERAIPADKEIIHLNGSDATIVGNGNTAVDAATGTLNLLANAGAGQYSITVAGGEYDVYANIASTARRGKIAFYADDAGFKSELDFGATLYHIPEYYSDDTQAYQNIYLGRYELAEGERAVTFKNPSDASHVYVHGGGPLYVRDIYFVKADAKATTNVIKAITYVNSNPYTKNISIDLSETVEFDISAKKAGLYSVDLYYGSEHDFVVQKYLNNPAVELYVNGKLIKTAALTAPNEKNSFTLKSVLGEVYLNEGANTITLKNVTTGTTQPTEGEDYFELENCSDILYINQLMLKPADAKIYLGEVAEENDWGIVEAGFDSEFSVQVDLNGALSGKDITMIFAVYEDGVPVHVATKEYTVSGSRNLVYTIPADVAINEDATYEVKVMMWDDLEGVKPLNNAISY